MNGFWQRLVLAVGSNWFCPYFENVRPYLQTVSNDARTSFMGDWQPCDHSLIFLVRAACVCHPWWHLQAQLAIVNKYLGRAGIDI